MFLKNKLKINKIQKDYFINQYYKPNIQIDLSKHLNKFANTSIDISDGLLTDLEKLINNQKLSYKVSLDDIPVSNSLNKLISKKNFLKEHYISKGDDYQVLFTASKDKRRIIKKVSNKLRVKISKIGIIQNSNNKPILIDKKRGIISLKNKGYFHHF